MKIKVLATLFLLSPFFLSAQNTYKVWVGSSPSPFFAPSTLVIEQGDVVEWENIEGTHNVSTTSGPEDFGNGSPAAGWTHSYTFNTVGDYGYECTVPGHAATQFGSITVLPSQTKFTVTAGGSPGGLPEPYFNVAVLTVQEGDTVVWENIEGFHDVTMLTGPEDFSFAPAGTGWTHEWVFNTAGSYSYECSVGTHGVTQFGDIIVEGASTGIEDAVILTEVVSVAPNPFTSEFIIDLSSWTNPANEWTIEIYSLDGKLMHSAVSLETQLFVSELDLEQGAYLLKVSDGKLSTTNIISKQ